MAKGEDRDRRIINGKEVVVPAGAMNGTIASRASWYGYTDKINAFYEAASDRWIEKWNWMRCFQVNPPLNNSSGYVYLMRDEDGISKIGISSDPYRRRWEVCKTVNRPVVVVKIWELPCWVDEAESALHSEFRDVCVGGEWFALTDDDIEKVSYLMDLWTEMIAEREQFE